jgi:hypothetical protein
VVKFRVDFSGAVGAEAQAECGRVFFRVAIFFSGDPPAAIDTNLLADRAVKGLCLGFSGGHDRINGLSCTVAGRRKGGPAIPTRPGSNTAGNAMHQWRKAVFHFLHLLLIIGFAPELNNVIIIV